MVFKETKLKGAYVVELDPIQDVRGYFARSFCVEEFKMYGLNEHIVQCNISCNKAKGTLRGMHFQMAPHEEAKLVSCTRGAMYDVIIDLRKESPTYMEWFSLELSEANKNMIYIPEGFAHGFQTLEDNTSVFYQMTEFYHPECARGIRCNDPAFNIDWPVSDLMVSEKDQSYPGFEGAL